jgi:hypothetical protein
MVISPQSPSQPTTDAKAETAKLCHLAPTCHFFAALTLVMTAAAALDGQLSTASINGTVLDSSGAIVADASFVLRNVQTTWKGGPRRTGRESS